MTSQIGISKFVIMIWLVFHTQQTTFLLLCKYFWCKKHCNIHNETKHFMMPYLKFESSSLNSVEPFYYLQIRVRNIGFLSPLVPSKRENLALLRLYTFWGKYRPTEWSGFWKFLNIKHDLIFPQSITYLSK